MKFSLRPYQQEASDKAIEFFQNKKKTNAIIVLPTGSGKSLVIAEIANRLNDHVLIFQPSKEILEQNFAKLQSYGFWDCSIYSASFNSKEISKVTFAMIGSVRNKPELFAHFKYVIIDECFTGETEILTEKGFIKFQELDTTIKVAQWWDNGHINFTNPLRHICNEHDGEMTLFNVKHGVCVPMTNNHQQIFRGQHGNIFKESISKAKFNGRTIPVSGKFKNEDIELTNLERLYIATQADGSIHGIYKEYVTVSFSFSKQRKIDRLLYLCEETGLHISEVKCSKYKRRFMVKMPKGTTKSIQNHINFPMSHQKAIKILDECMEWDGHKRWNDDSMYYFSSTDKSAVDFYNSVASISGNSAFISIERDNRSERFNDVYRLFITKNKIFRDCQQMKISKIQYTGSVYCVEVPSGAIIVRHNGYTFVSGNCHGVNSKNGDSMYNSFLSNLNCRVLGLTATPYRLSFDGFGGSILKFITRTRPRIFSEMIYHVQIKELADAGFLAKMEYYQVNIVDPSKLQVNSTGADYTDKSVQKHYSDIQFNLKLKEIIERLIKAGRKNILVFTRFVSEAQELSDYFNGLSEMVSGETPKKERERILNDFKSGEVKIVCNVGVLTTGFDFPELETVVLARPTMSLALYYQMIGRAMRPHESKKSAWVIDLCQTYKRFGKVESLELRAEKQNLWAVYSGNKQLTNTYYE